MKNKDLKYQLSKYVSDEGEVEIKIADSYFNKFDFAYNEKRESAVLTVTCSDIFDRLVDAEYQVSHLKQEMQKLYTEEYVAGLRDAIRTLIGD
jgi:hypothetical protein